MLWYKAWLETRARFLISLATLTLFAGLFVHHALYVVCANTIPCGQGLAHPVKQEDLHFVLLVTQSYVVIIWVLAVVLLGMGGIVHEKTLGTSSLTLSLPVSRTRLLAVRIALGVVQSVVLAIVPWVIIFLASRQAGAPVPITQAGLYVLLLVGGGMVYFAMAVLISSIVAGEYTAPALAFGIVLVGAIVFDLWLRPFNVWRLITGDFSVDRATYLLSPHLPWFGILVSLSAAMLMLVAATVVLQKREF